MKIKFVKKGSGKKTGLKATLKVPKKYKLRKKYKPDIKIYPKGIKKGYYV